MAVVRRGFTSRCWEISRRAQSVQWKHLLNSTEVRSRIQWPPIDWAVSVLAPERISRRKCIVGKLAVSWQDFGAGIQPRSCRDVDASMRSRLIGSVWSVGAVVKHAIAVIESFLGCRMDRKRFDHECCDGKQRHDPCCRNELHFHRGFPGEKCRFQASSVAATCFVGRPEVKGLTVAEHFRECASRLHRAASAEPQLESGWQARTVSSRTLISEESRSTDCGIRDVGSRAARPLLESRPVSRTG
jgi:hypothetical protein